MFSQPGSIYSCPRTRRDKEETKGSYTISQKESWNDRREMDVTEDLEHDGQASADDDSDDDDDQDDAGSSGSSGSSDSGSSAKGKKRKRASKSKKEKKEKTAKKNKKPKKNKKEKKSKKPRSHLSSPSSKAGSPTKDSEALEEEARSEARVAN